VCVSDERGGLLTRGDLAAYAPRWSDPAETHWLGMRFLGRDG